MIELKIFFGDIQFLGETNKISQHIGILIPPRTRKRNFKEKKIEKLDLCPRDHTYQEKVFCFGSTRSHIWNSGRYKFSNTFPLGSIANMG